MRVFVMALLLMFGAVSAVSGTVAVYAAWGKGAGCSWEPMMFNIQDPEPAAFLDASLGRDKMAHAVR